MKNLYQYIDELEIEQWHYYFGIDNNFETSKPFVDSLDYTKFILNYFIKSEKVKIFEMCGINQDELRLPNHICSVYFLGILLYYQTNFSKIYKLKNDAPGYVSFPFIWFLIALFHDNAYQMEDKDKLQGISTIQELKSTFDIVHSLFDQKFSKCKELLSVRSNYFLFRKQECDVVDHGILGGLLLFDRLVKIRREKERENKNNLFWGKKLEYQYKSAANAISIHNIWLQQDKICEEFNLHELKTFKAVKFKDFPLFYILGIVDTIEPLKIYRKDKVSDLDILKSLNFEFGEKSLCISESNDSKIVFNKLIDATDNFKGWLDIDIKVEKNKIDLKFK